MVLYIVIASLELSEKLIFFFPKKLDIGLLILPAIGVGTPQTNA